MKQNIFAKTVVREMKQHRTRTLVTIIGVAIASAMLTAVAVFAFSLRTYLLEQTIASEGSWQVYVQGLSAQEADAMAGDERVEMLYTAGELGYAAVDDTQGDGMYFRFVSRDAEAWKRLPVEIEEGRLPENENEVLLPETEIRVQGKTLETGDSFTVEMGQLLMDGIHVPPDQTGARMEDESLVCDFHPQREETFVVSGIYRNEYGQTDYYANGYLLYVGEGQGQQAYCDAYIEMKDPKDADRFLEDWIEGKDAPEYEGGVSWVRHDSLLRLQGVFRSEQYTGMIAGTLGTLILVIMAGAVSLIYNSFSISLRERTAQMGLLSSVGATKKQLRSSVRTEALIVGAAGIPLGIIAGIAGSGITLRVIGNGLVFFLTGGEGTILLDCPAWAILLAAALSFVTVLISAWIPSRRIRKITPMDAIRSAQDICIRPGGVRSGKLTEKLFGLPGTLAEKNYRRDRRKYKSTVISLTMSIVLFVTVSLFMRYLTAAGNVIMAVPKYDLEYYVVVEQDQEEVQTLERQEKMLEEQAAIDSWEVYRLVTIPIPMEKENFSGDYLKSNYWKEKLDGKIPFSCSAMVLRDREYDEYLQEQGLEKPEEEEGVLHGIYYDKMKDYDADEQKYKEWNAFSDRVGKRPLDAGSFENQEKELSFTPSFQIMFEQRARELPKQYTSDEASNPLLILSERQFEQFRQYLAGGSLLQFEIKARDYRQAGRDLQEAIQALPESERGTVNNMAAEAAANRQGILAIQVLCYGFIILISLIATANVFNTISTNLMLRRKEFAMLRSVGMDEKTFRRMMRYECVIYGVRSMLYGAVLSAGVSVVLWKWLAPVGGQSLILPWREMGVAVAGILVSVSATMLYTMKKIKRHNIIEELRIE